MIPEKLKKQIIKICKEVRLNDKFGDGYLPSIISNKLSKYSKLTKEIQKEFPLFNCCLNNNESKIGIYIDYDNQEYFLDFEIENILENNILTFNQFVNESSYKTEDFTKQEINLIKSIKNIEDLEIDGSYIQ